MKHNIPVRPKHVDDEVKHGNGELATVDDEEEEIVDEAKGVVPIADPGQPTAAEIQSHELTHCPFQK